MESNNVFFPPKSLESHFSLKVKIVETLLCLKSFLDSLYALSDDFGFLLPFLFVWCYWS